MGVGVLGGGGVDFVLVVGVFSVWLVVCCFYWLVGWLLVGSKSKLPFLKPNVELFKTI